MTRREELLFHQEVKFRNKVVEYLTDWVLLSDDKRHSLPTELTVLSKYVDLISYKFFSDKLLLVLQFMNF